jgi:hypothetical protein
MLKQIDVENGMDHYVYRDIKFSVTHELLKDAWDMHGVDVVEEMKHGINLAIQGYSVEHVVDLENKTARLSIIKREEERNTLLDK